MYLGKSSGFVTSDSLPILPLSCSLFSVASIFPVLNLISQCFIVQLPGHLVNFIVLLFQLISGLYLTSQSCPRNMYVPFKSVTAASNCFLCPLISISRGAILVISLFFILSVLKTSNGKFIGFGFVCILFFLTSYLSIPICIHPESTNVFTLRFLPFFVFIFARTFNSLSILLHQFGIIYLL